MRGTAAERPRTRARSPECRPKPSHQELLTSLVTTAVMMSSVPLKMRNSPSTEARAQNALKGRANAQIAPTTNRTPIKMCAHRQLGRTEAIRNSLTAPSRNRTLDFALVPTRRACRGGRHQRGRRLAGRPRDDQARQHGQARRGTAGCCRSPMRSGGQYGIDNRARRRCAGRNRSARAGHPPGSHGPCSCHGQRIGDRRAANLNPGRAACRTGRKRPAAAGRRSGACRCPAGRSCPARPGPWPTSRGRAGERMSRRLFGERQGCLEPSARLWSHRARPVLGLTVGGTWRGYRRDISHSWRSPASAAC